MGMSTRKVSLGCLPGYERKSAFKFSYGRLWILYFDYARQGHLEDIC